MTSHLKNLRRFIEKNNLSNNGIRIFELVSLLSCVTYDIV
jgi:hypothetical protein